MVSRLPVAMKYTEALRFTSNRLFSLGTDRKTPEHGLAVGSAIISRITENCASRNSIRCLLNVSTSHFHVNMPANCGACGIELHKTTDEVKCAGKCGLNYHSICTDLKTQRDIEILVSGKTQWFCNSCRSYSCDRIVENVNVSSRLCKKIEPKISDQLRSIIDDFFELRIHVEELLNKINKLEVAVNDINTADCKNSRRVIKYLQTYDKKLRDCVDNVKIYEQQESEGNFNIGESNVRLSRDEYMATNLERISKSLKVHVFLLAAITLIFVICKICGL